MVLFIFTFVLCLCKRKKKSKETKRFVYQVFKILLLKTDCFNENYMSLRLLIAVIKNYHLNYHWKFLGNNWYLMPARYRVPTKFQFMLTPDLLFNQSGHERSRQTSPPPPISKYFNKKRVPTGIRTHDSQRRYPLHHKSLDNATHGICLILSLKN